MLKIFITVLAGVGLGSLVSRIMPEANVRAVMERAGIGQFANFLPFIWIGLGVLAVFLIRKKVSGT